MNYIKNKLEAKHVYLITMITIYLYLIIHCIYKHILGDGFEKCKLEFILIIVTSLIVYLVSFLNINNFNKKNNKLLLKEIRNNCIYDALFLSLNFTTYIYLLIAYENVYINFYNIIPNQLVLSVIGLALLIFIIFFIIIYLVMFNIFRIKFTKQNK